MTFLQIKWRCCHCIILAFFCFPALAQINITGRVVDENSDSALAGASVYFNKTTIGTYTNSQGDFYFETLHLVNTELVIYCPGYELLVYKPDAAQVEGKRIVFKLQPKEPPPQNMQAPGEALRNRWLQVFKENFLGITEEAEKCIVANEGIVYFGQYTNTSLSVYADTPLVIISKMLGYKLIVNLVEFLYDEASGQYYFNGYIRYEELSGSKAFAINRRNCYYGSTLHFYRSLISRQLYQQGFGAFLIQTAKDTGIKGKNGRVAENPKEPGIAAVPVSESDILYIDSTNNFSIRATGRLLVQYNKNPSAKKYLERKMYVEGNLGKGIESAIIFKDASTELNYAGVLSNALNVEYEGYWSYERVANSLPYNYQPE